MPEASGRGEIHVDNVILGTFLLGSPWLFGFSIDPVAAWCATLSGLAIIAAAFLAPVALGAKVELALGGWSTLSPIVLGFVDTYPAAVIHAGVGLVLALLAVAEIWAGRSTPPAMRV